MSKPKEPISVEKIQVAIVALDAMKQTLEKMIVDAEKIKKEHAMIEGWPTFARGYNFMLDQAAKFSGGVSLLDDIDPRDMLMPGQEYSPTKKPYTPRNKEKQIADAKTSRSKAKTKRNNDRD